MIYIFLFIFGTIIGSFLNVLGLRYNSGLGIEGRSMCLTCGETLKWHELIPVVSYFFRLGRCRSCRSPIAFQYPAVELFTGFVFVYAYRALLPGAFDARFLILFILLAATFCVYIVIAIYDLRHKIIPDSLVYPAIVLAGAFSAVAHRPVSDWLAGVFIFLFFFTIWFISKGKAMGFGDAKLGLSIGFLLGLVRGLSALAFAFWVGTAVALALMMLSKTYPLFKAGKKLTIKSEIPFAPFLVFGAWLALIFHADLFHLSSFIK
ncbi:MAG: prepilin peptidase leader peptidase (prepilin peptidase) / N-methyltransferase [Parcubacteria group bacterium]|nr:prepilin peptidase leader peptidase (prepilin peptidase) / N-methyltransferase [Parcubacteria group bacterium]